MTSLPSASAPRLATASRSASSSSKVAETGVVPAIWASVPAAQAARVVAQLVEFPWPGPLERVGLVQRLQEGGLAALVLAHQTGDVWFETDAPRILDAPNFRTNAVFRITFRSASSPAKM